MHRAIWVLPIALAMSCFPRYPKLELRTPEQKRFIHLMGQNDMLLHFKDYQSHLAEPINNDGLQQILTKVEANLRAASRIRIYAAVPERQKALDNWFTWALDRVAAARKGPWTAENARTNFDWMRETCRACHDQFME